MNEAQQRKQCPIFSGVVKYFPDALKAVARVSFIGNEQHNKGEPLHWAREKSTDQLDALMRHLTDYASGDIYDTDGINHIYKVCWRALAQAQLDIENEYETPIRKGIQSPRKNSNKRDKRVDKVS